MYHKEISKITQSGHTEGLLLMLICPFITYPRLVTQPPMKQDVRGLMNILVVFVPKKLAVVDSSAVARGHLYRQIVLLNF